MYAHVGRASRSFSAQVENDEDLDDADLRVLADHQRNASAPPVDLTEGGPLLLE